jgi:hypothetical protein
VRWLVVLAVGSGCYAPRPQVGAPCPNGECPEGQVCSPATGTCELQAIDAGRRDGPLDDAADDAALIDAPRDAAVMVAPTLVQQVTNLAANATTVAATLTAAPTSGRVLVLIGGITSGSLATVTGGGATWTQAAGSFTNSNIEIWVGVTDGSSSTVTISRPGGVSTIWLSVSEWSGLATTNVIDAAAADDGTAVSATAGAIATTSAPDLVFFAASAFAANTFGNPTPNAWTAMTPIAGSTTMGAWYRVESATGTFAPSVTHTGAEWDAAVAALRIAP